MTLTLADLDRLEALRLRGSIRYGLDEELVLLLKHEAELIALARQALGKRPAGRVIEGVAKCHVDESDPDSHSIWWSLHRRDGTDKHYSSSDVEWFGGLEDKHIHLAITVIDDEPKEPR